MIVFGFGDQNGEFIKRQVLENPDTFRNQGLGYMQMFKAFCEGRPRG